MYVYVKHNRSFKLKNKNYIINLSNYEMYLFSHQRFSLEMLILFYM